MTIYTHIILKVHLCNDIDDSMLEDICRQANNIQLTFHLTTAQPYMSTVSNDGTTHVVH